VSTGAVAMLLGYCLATGGLAWQLGPWALVAAGVIILFIVFVSASSER